MKFCWSTFYVKDMEKSVQFYTEIIGLSINRRFKHGDAEMVFLSDGITTLELICIPGRPSGNAGSDISWGFETESLEDTLNIMKTQSVKIVSELLQPSPSVRFFFAEYPDGLKIQIVQNLSL